MLTMNSNFVPHGFRPRLAGSITAHYAIWLMDPTPLPTNRQLVRL
jgi:hypothetical protein